MSQNKAKEKIGLVSFTSSNFSITARQYSEGSTGGLKDLQRPSTSQTIATKSKPGVVHIFNQAIFDDITIEYRDGSTNDVERLRSTFAKFEMEIHVHEDFDVVRIQKKIDEIKNTNFSQHSCIVITILSHGKRRDEIHARDKPFLIDDIMVFPILKNPTLTGVPKIFLIQACKGTFETAAMTDSPTDAILIRDSEITPPPTALLKFYSSTEGYKSYRYRWGTPFIKSFCDNLTEYGNTDGILSITRRVKEDVIKETK